MQNDPPKARLFRRRKIWLLSLSCVLLIAIAVVLSSCIQISGLNLNSNATAGSDHLITLNVESQVDWPSPIRATVAIRIPEAWDVTSVSFTGALSGSGTFSTNMRNFFQGEWQAKPVDASHNGAKPGYKWWAGYTVQRPTWSIGEVSTMVVHINTHGRGGTYLLDFVFGYTDATDPNNVTNKGNWELGGLATGDPPTPKGILLDRQIILHCFSDVGPGAPFYAAIQGLGARGIIQGYPPDAGGFAEFKPQNSVTRAQYTKFICNALNWAGVPGFVVAEGMAPPVNFPDLGVDNPADLYPHEYIWTAYVHNIIKGYLDGRFQPNIPISRAHVITMTVRALQGIEPSPLTAPPPGYSGNWGGDMAPEHMANARIAEFNGLFNGIPVASGNAGMPRGEVAQVMWNMMNMLGP